MKTLFLDTETTGLHPPRDKLVEVAIIDLNGNVLLNTLVNPGREIGSEAIAIHHITDDMVATAPTLEQLWPEIQDIVRGSHLIIYNSAFDTRFFPDGLGCARKVTCAMKRFARIYGQWNPRYGSYRWQKLIKAAEHVGYTWECEAHRALGDALAARAVWKWMERQDSSDESELRRRGAASPRGQENYGASGNTGVEDTPYAETVFGVLALLILWLGVAVVSSIGMWALDWDISNWGLGIATFLITLLILALWVWVSEKFSSS